MIKDLLALGITWKVYSLAEEDAFVLELGSIYGIVSLKLLGTQGRLMTNAIVRTYKELEVQGPIQPTMDTNSSTQLP